MMSISSLGEHSCNARQPWSLKPALAQDTWHPASQTQRQLGRENHLLSAPSRMKAFPWPLAPALTFSSTLEIQRIGSFFRQLTVAATLRPRVSIRVEKGGGKKSGEREDKRKELEGAKGDRRERQRWERGMRSIWTTSQEEGLGITCCFQGHVTRSGLCEHGKHAHTSSATPSF